MVDAVIARPIPRLRIRGRDSDLNNGPKGALDITELEKIWGNEIRTTFLQDDNSFASLKLCALVPPSRN